MSNAARTIIVFVDTSYLSRRPNDQEADWNKLLRLSEEQKIEVYISHIAIEEYRTQTRDNLNAKIEQAKKALKNLHRAWYANLNISKELGIFIQPDIFPIAEEVEEASQKTISEFIAKNHINILKPASTHSERVWSKYFSWATPFRFFDVDTRDDKTVRESRRKDIPDAWIYEAALDLCSDKTRVLCMCKDEKFANAFRKGKIETFENAKDVLEIIETPLVEFLSESDLSQVKNQETSASSVAGLDQHLLNLAVREKKLQIRILGYTQWFSPLSKTELTNMLQEKGHIAETIENAAQHLTLNGLLKDTGNHYIPGNKSVCKQAAETIMDEILEILDRQ